MLTDKDRKRVPGHVLNFTEAWTSSQAMGYKSHALSIPAYDSQEDFDRCRPGDAGQPFEDHNDFMSEIVKGLSVNGVPTEIVVFHWAEFDKWLAGRPVEPNMRVPVRGLPELSKEEGLVTGWWTASSTSCSSWCSMAEARCFTRAG